MKNLIMSAVMVGLYLDWFIINSVTELVIFILTVWFITNIADRADYFLAKKIKR